ncbi:hypothetical protein Rleg4DRAFT_2476 [Rhizobium leguminosarum bv. trifolii WSM2297]|uniref:Uncharacterized protein n=1 Tax=Rhizobium leguminosarum bv. trifolii WSM2297 TaxID=754762 RepID=J0KT78_RHILT|nr:hypothetical protein [Rhizobium leguminosarum]EJC80814.1 hypothetical protein Rleg4DRAFT_2476 [Rhizobium leguminosarum bv. trifolii WSM2297]
MTNQVDNANITEQRSITDTVLNYADVLAMVLKEYDRLNRKRRPFARPSQDIAESGARKALIAWTRMPTTEKIEFRAAAHIGRKLKSTK